MLPLPDGPKQLRGSDLISTLNLAPLIIYVV